MFKLFLKMKIYHTFNTIDELSIKLMNICFKLLILNVKIICVNKG